MATFTMRMDVGFKKAFDSVCRELGCDMPTVVRMLGMRMIRDRRIPFEFCSDPFDLPANQAHIERSIRELEEMRGKTHELIGERPDRQPDHLSLRDPLPTERAKTHRTSRMR